MEVEQDMISIRRLQLEVDFEDLFLLSQAFFKEYQSHHLDFFQSEQLEERNVRAYFTSFLGSEDRAAFIALVDDQIVGYITVYVQTQAPNWKVKRIGQISGLMVAQGYRRQGIASQLLARAVNFFRERELRYYTMFTAVGNQGGLEFYRANGMEPLYAHLLGQVVPRD
jgi:ribosomal protein S18 acetylase RimI-like enzyme